MKVVVEKELILENGLEKLEKHTFRCPEAGKAGKKYALDIKLA